MQETDRKRPNARFQQTRKLLTSLDKIEWNQYASLSVEPLANPYRAVIELAPFRNANRKKLRTLLITDFKQILKAFGGYQSGRFASSCQQCVGRPCRSQSNVQRRQRFTPWNSKHQASGQHGSFDPRYQFIPHHCFGWLYRRCIRFGTAKKLPIRYGKSSSRPIEFPADRLGNLSPFRIEKNHSTGDPKTCGLTNTAGIDPSVLIAPAIDVSWHASVR